MVFKLLSGEYWGSADTSKGVLLTCIICLVIELQIFISSYRLKKIRFKHRTLPKFWHCMTSELHFCHHKRQLKCCYLLQQHIYVEKYLQHLPIWWPNTDLDSLYKVNCIYLYKKVTKNWQFVPSKASTSLLLNVITQCKYWVWLDILDKFHFYLYEGLWYRSRNIEGSWLHKIWKPLL